MHRVSDSSIKLPRPQTKRSAYAVCFVADEVDEEGDAAAQEENEGDEGSVDEGDNEDDEVDAGDAGEEELVEDDDAEDMDEGEGDEVPVEEIDEGASDQDEEAEGGVGQGFYETKFSAENMLDDALALRVADANFPGAAETHFR